MILTGLLPDGTRDLDATFTVDVLHPDTQQPIVTRGVPWRVTLRPISSERFDRLRKAHTRRVPNKLGRMEEQTDTLGLNDAMLTYAIVTWEGLQVADPDGGAEAVALECTEAAKKHLPPWLGSQLVEAAVKAMRSSAEDDAQSFREP